MMNATMLKLSTTRGVAYIAARRLLHRSRTVEQSQARVVFSGIQPTGVPHLGNYIGALQNWVKMQNDPTYDTVLYSIVDLHSLTTSSDPALLRQHIRESAMSLLAAGINPEKCVLYQQSRIAQHAELAWILGCQTRLSQLNTMTQWKVKKGKAATQKLGLFSYPVLMAADILLYKATDIPVGDDQSQHLELARNLAVTFNTAVGTEYFTKPDPLIGAGGRIMNLRDPTSKMSKSAKGEGSKIQLTDPPDIIRAKIRKAVSDSNPEIFYDADTRPGVANLIQIYASMDKTQTFTADNAAQVFKGMNTLQFKDAVADATIEYLTPIQNELQRLQNENGYVDQVLDQGAATAQTIATATMKDVKQLIGC